MMSNYSQTEEPKEKYDQSENEEASIYSDACSNSLEIAQLIEKEQEKTENNKIEKNKNEIKTIIQNDSSLISMNDIHSQNRKGSMMSFNSTNSTSYIKKNCKNLPKLKVNIPNIYPLNNKYATNNAQILTPIEEKGRGTDGLNLQVFSAENKKQKTIFDQKDFFNIRQSLESKNNNFIFSPNINNNQNYFTFKSNINLNTKTAFQKNKDNDIIDPDNNNISISSLINKKRKSYKKNSKEKLNKTNSSFKLIPGENILQKRPSINSTLDIRNFFTFDKVKKISETEFREIKKDEIDLDFLKEKFRTIPVKTNKKSDGNRYIKNLIEVQNFYVEKSPIWVMKLSKNYEYLALGTKTGFIKIFSIYNYNSDDYDFIYTKKNISNYFKLFSENPFLVLKKHTKDITDLSWSPFNFELLLSSSVDNYVILWDISKTKGDNIIKKFNHNEIISCLSFSPVDPNIFVTGCFDRFIRFFKIDDSIINQEENNDIDNTNIKLNDSKSTINVNFNNFGNLNKFTGNNNITNNKFDLFNYFNINEIVTAIEFFPDGSKIAVGTHNSKVLVYNIFPKISYGYCFFCRNRLGKFSSGKKITAIHFIDKLRALITTADSRVRLISMNNGKIIHKYKGNRNLDSMIKSSSDLINDVLICGSEDNFCYIWDIWDIFNNDEKNVKNYKYEYFKPFAKENIYCSLIAPEICYTNYIKKIYELTNKMNIISVIINATDNGRLEVLLNVEEN